MDKGPQVWCVVLSWNGRDDTLSCLNSLKASTYENLHILVVENASTDGTVEAIRESHPDVMLLINDENLRWAGGNNVGIKHAMEAGADYVFLLNNDIEIAPDMVTKMMAVAIADERPRILAPKIYYHARRSTLWFAGGGVNLWRGRIWHFGIRQHDDGQFDHIREVDYITGCAMLIPRAIIDDVGLIDPAYYLYGEDVDYSLRTRRAGYDLCMVPDAVMWHKVSASLGGISMGKIRMKLASNLRLFRRYAPAWAWFTTIPLFMFIDALRVLGLLLTGKFIATKKRS